MQVGKQEVLRDTLRFAKKAKNEGMQVKLCTKLDAFHIHPILFPKDPKSLYIMQEIKEFLNTLE
jgi:hypothetical protein